MGQDGVEWESRSQFYAIASRVIRSVLVDQARWRHRQKRGGDRRSVPIEKAGLSVRDRSEDVIALDAALDRLEIEDERLARIVECRFFGGLTIDETAGALEVSPSTVKRGWVLARAWLHRAMTAAPEAGGGSGAGPGGDPA